MPRKDSPLLENLSRRLQNASGPTYWRSLDELAGTDDFQDYLHREFPEAASEWDHGSDRDSESRLHRQRWIAGVGGADGDVRGVACSSGIVKRQRALGAVNRCRSKESHRS